MGLWSINVTIDDDDGGGGGDSDGGGVIDGGLMRMGWEAGTSNRRGLGLPT